MEFGRQKSGKVKENFVCEMCKTTFRTGDDFHKHLKHFKCSSMHTLQQYLKQTDAVQYDHGTTATYVCGNCDYKFTSGPLLELHLSSGECVSKQLQIEVQDAHSSSRECFEGKPQNTTQYTCAFCNQAYNTQAGMRRHISRMHPKPGSHQFKHSLPELLGIGTNDIDVNKKSSISTQDNSKKLTNRDVKTSENYKDQKMTEKETLKEHVDSESAQTVRVQTRTSSHQLKHSLSELLGIDASDIDVNKKSPVSHQDKSKKLTSQDAKTSGNYKDQKMTEKETLKELLTDSNSMHSGELQETANKKSIGYGISESDDDSSDSESELSDVSGFEEIELDENMEEIPVKSKKSQISGVSSNNVTHITGKEKNCDIDKHGHGKEIVNHNTQVTDSYEPYSELHPHNTATKSKLLENSDHQTYNRQVNKLGSINTKNENMDKTINHQIKISKEATLSEMDKKNDRDINFHSVEPDKIVGLRRHNQKRKQLSFSSSSESEDSDISCTSESEEFEPGSDFDSDDSGEDDNVKYQCNVCNKTFDKISHLKTHLKTHLKNPVKTQSKTQTKTQPKIQPKKRKLSSQNAKLNSTQKKPVVHSNNTKSSNPTISSLLAKKCEVFIHATEIVTNDKCKDTSANSQSSKTGFTNKIVKPLIDQINLLSEKNSIQADPGNSSDGQVSECMSEYICGICKCSVKTSEQLKVHIMMSHADTQDQFVCSLCKREFSTLPSLQNHMKLHTKPLEEQYVCGMCSQIFSSTKLLQAHMISHARTNQNNGQLSNGHHVTAGVNPSNVQISMVTALPKLPPEIKVKLPVPDSSSRLKSSNTKPSETSSSSIVSKLLRYKPPLPF